MSATPETGRQRHVMWITGGPLTTLDAATWLETTRELSKLGWRVTLVGEGRPSRRRMGQADVLCIPTVDIYFLRVFIFHMRVLRVVLTTWNSLDVILFHQLSAPWILPLGIVRRLTGKRCPLVVMDTRTVHMDSTPGEMPSWKNRLRRWFHVLMNRCANRWADGQTAITRRMAECINIPRPRLWGVWPSGVRTEMFAKCGATRDWPSDGEPIHLMYVGVLRHERHLVPLCLAAQEVNTRGMKLIVTLIGSGPARADLEELAAASKGQISVVGPVAYESIPDFLARAHVGVLPFPNEERFRVSSPIKLFEYMAAGLPVLATRIDCHTDVIGDEEFAFWAEDSSVEGLVTAMQSVLAARARLPRLGHVASRAAQAWTWHQSAMNLHVALERGIEQGRPAAAQREGRLMVCRASKT